MDAPSEKTIISSEVGVSTARDQNGMGRTNQSANRGYILPKLLSARRYFH
jgi:hypothetical protein